jgi:hypothetical protein
VAIHRVDISGASIPAISFIRAIMPTSGHPENRPPALPIRASKAGSNAGEVYSQALLQAICN